MNQNNILDLDLDLDFRCSLYSPWDAVRLEYSIHRRPNDLFLRMICGSTASYMQPPRSSLLYVSMLCFHQCRRQNYYLALLEFQESNPHILPAAYTGGKKQ